MIRTVVLGAGSAGQRQVEAIRELGARLVVHGLADNDAGFLREQSAGLGVKRTYGDVSEAIADPEVDAVSICLPHALHGAVAVAALDAGKHVLCEKPIAMTVDEAREMMAAADRSGCRLYVAENAVYTPMTRQLQEIVTSGEHVGEVVAASVVTGFRADRYGYPGRRAWLSTPEAGGSGHWLLNGIHTIAQVRAVFGEIETVYAREHKSGRIDRTDVEGTLTCQLGTEKGYQIALMQSREVYVKGGLKGITIFGDRGTVRAGDERYEVFGADGRQGTAVTYPQAPLSPYALEMEAFADYVTDGTLGPTGAASETRSLAVVLAACESAETGTPVAVRDRFGV